RLVEQLEQMSIRAVEQVGRPVPALPIDPATGIAKLLNAPLERGRAGAAEGGVSKAGGRRLGEGERGALIVPIAWPLDGLALLADDLEAQYVGEEALALLWVRGEQLDVREVGDVVDWLVDLDHGYTPGSAQFTHLIVQFVGIVNDIVDNHVDREYTL